jgi:hypothetical protein
MFSALRKRYITFLIGIDLTTKLLILVVLKNFFYTIPKNIVEGVGITPNL